MHDTSYELYVYDTALFFFIIVRKTHTLLHPLKQETPWEEALRSQMPRFGKPGIVQFKPNLPEGSSAFSPENEQYDGLAV